MNKAVEAAGSPSTPPGPIPIETLFRQPYFTLARLSPDGKSLAGLNYEADGNTNLAILDFGRSGASILKGSERLNIRSFLWLNDESLLVHGIVNKIYAGGLHVVDRSDFRRVYPYSSHGSHIVVGRPKARPKRILVWTPPYRSDDTSNVLRLYEVSSDEIKRASTRMSNTPTINRDRVNYPEPKASDGTVLGYESDVVGELALCYVYRDGKVRLLLFDMATGTWNPLSFDADTSSILAVEADHQHLWISEFVDASGYQVRRYNVATKERGPVLLTDAFFDPGRGSAFYSLVDGTLAGVSYSQHRIRNVWLLSKFAELQKSVDQLLPGTDNILVDTDSDEKLFVYYSVGAHMPGAYYMLDSERGLLTPITKSYPWLSGFDFATTSPVTFKASDGLQLQGYLTMPPSASAHNKVPLVVLCHGGPSSRDTWSFNREAQFLASRGYAVLQPNYRGSSGFIPAISRDWDYDYRRMHDDITDATKAFRQFEKIDGERVAIMGASFGGFLAVSGAAFEDGLYRCAITNSGVFDWEQLTRNAKWEGRPGSYEMLKDHLGKPGTNAEDFARISPMAAVDDIRIPVFIAHGQEDNVVAYQQSTKLASRLKSRKIPVGTFFPRDELHGFRSPENVKKYYEQVEAFLARYLRGQEIEHD